MKRKIFLLTILFLVYSQVYSQRKVDKSTTNALFPCVHDPFVNNQISNILGSTTNIFKICDYHIFKLRDALKLLGVPPPQNKMGTIFSLTNRGSQVLPAVFKYPNGHVSDGGNKYEINMLLGKIAYKKFEPILGEFILVNHDSLPLDINGLFDYMLSGNEGGPNILITDDKGNKWSKNKLDFVGSFFFQTPTYIVEPGDTLFVSMPLNDWAADSRDLAPSPGTDKAYFGYVGYFPPAKYRITFSGTDFSDEHIPFECTSDEFTVVEDNEEDMEILRLSKEGRDDEIPIYYSSNSLAEHEQMQSILYRYNAYTYSKNENDPQWDNLMQDYENFIVKYPDSYYLLYDRFMTPYMAKVAARHSSYEDIKTDLNNRMQNEMIRKYLMNKQRVMTKFKGYQNKRNDR